MKLSVMISIANKLFEDVERMARLTPEQAKTIVQSYFKDCLERMEFQLDTVDSYSSAMMRIAKGNQNLEELSEIDLTVDNGRYDFLLPDNFKYDENKTLQAMSLGFTNHFDGDISKIIEYLSSRDNVEVIKGSSSYKALEKAVSRSVAELKRIQALKMDYESDIEIQDGWFIEKPIETIPESLKSVLEPIEDNIDTSQTLSLLFKDYIDECKRNGEKDRGREQKRVTVDLLVNIIGDIPIATFKTNHARKFKSVLLSMPANANKVKEYKDLKPLDFLDVSVPDDSKLKANTVNGYFNRLRAFFTWLNDNGYCEFSKNPFAGLGLKNKVSAKDQRDSFTENQLKTLFTSPIYLGRASDKQTDLLNSGDIIAKNEIYWIPLIALYTGARLGEIYGLECKDIILHDDVMVFDINDDGDNKSLKTSASKRKVPIHSIIINAGFEDYVLNRQKLGRSKLFTDPNKDNYSKRFRNLLKRLNIKTNKTTFHSFRHSMKDALLGAGVSENINRAILGHEDGSAHSRYGSAGIPIKMMKDAIEKVKFDFIHLK